MGGWPALSGDDGTYMDENAEVVHQVTTGVVAGVPVVDERGV